MNASNNVAWEDENGFDLAYPENLRKEAARLYKENNWTRLVSVRMAKILLSENKKAIASAKAFLEMV
jgi:hypothetical protein